MKRYIVTFLLSMICLSPIAAQPQQPSTDDMMQGKMIQIVLEKNSQGKANPMLIDTKGQKMPLTLGTLLNATAESYMDMGGTNAPIKTDPNTIVYIRFMKDAKGKVTSRLVSKTGRDEKLDFGNLLSEAAVVYPGCNADKINGQNVDINIHFEKDEKGYIQAYLMGENGKETFNLGSMFKEVTLMLNKCEQQQ